MSENGNTAPVEAGFEHDGTFYRWFASTGGKDLILIDRIANVAVTEFFELLDDPVARERPSVMLALVATSMRARHPEWSVERIVRTVYDLDVNELTLIGGDEEEPVNPLPPPTPSGPEQAVDELSSSPDGESRQSAIPAEPSVSETSAATLP
jgi:hypothetical protein